MTKISENSNVSKLEMSNSRSRTNNKCFANVKNFI